MHDHWHFDTLNAEAQVKVRVLRNVLARSFAPVLRDPLARDADCLTVLMFQAGTELNRADAGATGLPFPQYCHDASLAQYLW
jgi:hypothetical protein